MACKLVGNYNSCFSVEYLTWIIVVCDYNKDYDLVEISYIYIKFLWLSEFMFWVV